MFSWANSANIFGWPASAIIVSTRAAPFASMWSTSARRIRARSITGIDAHGPSSNARRASPIARPNSATGVTETSVKCDSSAGFSTESDSSPSTQRPATYDWRSVISAPTRAAPPRCTVATVFRTRFYSIT